MNKVILMGRLVKAPEVRYTQSSEPLAVARYTLAVNRRFKRQGEQEADFINCVAFGKNGEFAEKYLKKGLLISVVGRIQSRSYTDSENQKRFVTEVIVEEHYFTADKSEQTNTATSTPASAEPPASYKQSKIDDYNDQFGW